MPSRRELANAIRALSMDAVQKANSGHPGAPMGMADIAEVLWRDVLSHNPADPHWINRDRFVLSNGHGSMLQYALLHLTGYDLGIEDLKQFRQLHSRTPGHPEYGYTIGVETTTGPLGQGIANAVGMAIAERLLAEEFNRDDMAVIDHHTWVFLGDGCLMEGISHEVCSLAGTLGLGKLIAVYDDNGISIDGEVEGWFTDDTVKRFEAYGWHVIGGVDGHDAAAIEAAFITARAEQRRPTLICARTTIGFGSPNKAGKESSHGSPLGEEEIRRTREALGWTAAPFEIPADISAAWNQRESGNARQQAWQAIFDRYQAEYPDLAVELCRRLEGRLPDAFAEKLAAYVAACQQGGESIASRKASQNTLNALGPQLPELLGGSADLAGSNLTIWSGSVGMRAPASRADTAETTQPGEQAANYLYYGVREFGMSAIMNGIALHGGFIPYGATFLVFMEYARNAVRMAALMQQRVLFIYTHDSIGLGEDGPTHQAVEQLATLRLTPNLETWRPCDTVESAVAWGCALQHDTGPSALVFSRQTLPHQQRSAEQVEAISRGAYILDDSPGEPALILIATGSEVALAREAAQQLRAAGHAVRVVSMPCSDRFDVQDAAYRQAVLPLQVTARLAIEAGIADWWYKYVGLDGRVVGMTGFGESAPAEDLFRHFGFTVENVVEQALELLGN